MIRVHVPLPPVQAVDRDVELFGWLDNLPALDSNNNPYMMTDSTTIEFYRDEDALAFKLRFRL